MRNTVRHKLPSNLPALRQTLIKTLLAYAAGFGATEDGTQRRLAAKLWHTLPKGISPDEAVTRLNRTLSVWGEGICGQPVSIAALRMAFLLSGADTSLILAPKAETGELAQNLLATLPQPVPARNGLAMPVQSLRPLSLAALLSPASATRTATPAHAG
jgi:hypothetical protein